MITIESDALITVAVAIVSTIVSSIATWQFSKRRYPRARKQVTEEEIQLEKVKNEFRSEMLIFLCVLAVIMAFLALFVIIALSTRTS